MTQNPNTWVVYEKLFHHESIGQNAVCEQVEWEDRQGNAVKDGEFGIDLEGLYHPLEMKQPEEKDRADPE